MSRSKNFFSGLVFGYGTIGANIAYTLASVPLALHYLGKEEFGLWALAQQVAGYLLLLDLGISSAVSRFLADHKDNVNGGEYGSLLLTGGMVFLLQGLLIAIVGVGFSVLAPPLFSVPPTLAEDFTRLLGLLSLLAGLTVALRSIGSPLWAFQRLDLVNLVSAGGLLLGLVMLWAGFQLGLGIYSVVLAPIPGLILATASVAILCYSKGYYPSAGAWGRPRWQVFCGVFVFGKDILLMSIGSQLVNASQVMIISRLLGLDAAATYSIATKFATMGQQFVGKILESSAPGLTEMFVRGEHARFARRFWDILSATAAVAAIGGAGLAVCNRGIVEIWTRGAIHWPASGDLLLGLGLICTALSRAVVGLFGITKNLRPVRHVYLVEGLIFVALAFVLGTMWGIAGILVASLLAQLLITTPLALVAARPVLRTIQPAVKAYLIPAAICIVLWLGFVELAPPTKTWPQMLAVAGSVLIVSSLAAFYLVFSPVLRKDISLRLRGRIRVEN